MLAIDKSPRRDLSTCPARKTGRRSTSAPSYHFRVLDGTRQGASYSYAALSPTKRRCVECVRSAARYLCLHGCTSAPPTDWVRDVRGKRAYVHVRATAARRTNPGKENRPIGRRRRGGAGIKRALVGRDREGRSRILYAN